MQKVKDKTVLQTDNIDTYHLDYQIGNETELL